MSVEIKKQVKSGAVKEKVLLRSTISRKLWKAMSFQDMLGEMNLESDSDVKTALSILKLGIVLLGLKLLLT